MFARLIQLLRDLLEFIYPAACLICEQPQTSRRTHLLCEKCLEEIASCPLPNVHAISAAFDKVGEHLDAVHAGWPFDAPMQAVIHAFKYRRRPSLSKVFGIMLAQRLQNVFVREIQQTAAFDAILVPVPLHRRRGRERGFNQSMLLAQTLAGIWKMKILPRALERIRFTQQQAKLTAAERQKNVEGAFAPTAKFNLSNRTIILVDDVFTTGATMNACASALKAAGAVRVIGLVMAKAGN
jgi:ComF family protein